MRGEHENRYSVSVMAVEPVGYDSYMSEEARASREVIMSSTRRVTKQ